MSKRSLRWTAMIGLLLVAAVGLPVAYRRWSAWEVTRLAERCRVAASRQRWNEADSLARQWSQSNPAQGEAWLIRGQAAGARGDWASAVEHYRHVSDDDPHVVPAALEIAKLSFGPLNDPLRGIAASERLSRLDPSNANAHRQLITFYVATLQRHKLRREIRAAIQANCEPPDASVYDFLSFTLRYADALPLNERWLRKYPDEETFLVARFLLQVELSNQASESAALHPSSPDYPTAEVENSKMEQVERLLDRFPSNIELLAYKANLCMATGNVDKAVHVLAQAPKEAGDDARFWRLKGWVHESNDELDAAHAAYTTALELHPVDWITMSRLAVVERRRRNVAEVERLTELVDRALDLRNLLRKAEGGATTNPAALRELSRFYRDCGDATIGPALERRLARKNR